MKTYKKQQTFETTIRNWNEDANVEKWLFQNRSIKSVDETLNVVPTKDDIREIFNRTIQHCANHYRRSDKAVQGQL